MNKCNQCGRTYHEWECPTCAEQGMTLKTAQDIDAFNETNPSIQTAPPPKKIKKRNKHKRDQAYLASEGWRLEVQSKLAKAIELYFSDMYQEALLLTESLLQQDPSNINIYLLLERIYDATGEYGKGKVYADKAQQLLTLQENATKVEAHIQVAYAQADSSFRHDQIPPDTISTSMDTILEIHQEQDVAFKRTKLAVARHFAHEFDEVYELYSLEACQSVKQLIQNKCSQWEDDMEFNGLRTAFSTAWFVVNQTFGYSVFMAIAMGIMLVLKSSIHLYNLFVSVTMTMLITSIIIFAFELLHWYIQHEKSKDILLNSSESEPFYLNRYNSSLIFWLLNTLSLGVFIYVGTELYPYLLWAYNTALPYVDDVKEVLQSLLEYL